MPLLPDVVLIFLSSIVVLTQNVRIFIVSLLRSESDMSILRFCCAWGELPAQRLSLRPSISTATFPPFHYCNPLMASRLYTQDDFQHLSMSLDAHLII
jgi:hypothetical protein